jgi:hypothetical protein
MSKLKQILIKFILDEIHKTSHSTSFLAWTSDSRLQPEPGLRTFDMCSAGYNVHFLILSMHGTWPRLVINTLHISEKSCCAIWCSHNGILVCYLTTFLIVTVVGVGAGWVSETGVAVEKNSNNECNVKICTYLHTYIHTHTDIHTFLVALRPIAGHGLLILEVSRSHNDAPQSVGLSGRRNSSSQRPLPDFTQHP